MDATKGQLIMELNNHMSAIFEVSEAVARMPCAPQDKNEVLEKIKNLFSHYTILSKLFADRVVSPDKSKETDNSISNQTVKKDLATASAMSAGHNEMQEKLEVMDRKIRTLEQKLEAAENQSIEELSGQRRELDGHVTTSSQIRHAQDSITHRVAQIENRSNELEVLKTRIEIIDDSVKNVSSNTSSLEDELLKMHGEIANLEGLVHKKAKDPENSVAFSAYSTSNHQKYKKNQVIQFQGVLFNLRSCYDAGTGVFISKALGWYVFTTSINTNSDGYFTASISLNGEEVAHFGTPGTRDLQTGTSVVLRLQPGDTVSVKVTSQSHDDGVEVGGGFSNFVGYKIA